MTTVRSLAAVALLGLAAIGCGGDNPSDATPPPPPPPPPPGGPASIAIQAGNGQQAEAGRAVAVAPSVIVRNAAGDPVAGVVVAFSVTAGGGTLAGANPSTNASGIAAVTGWTLGSAGAQKLRAQVGALPPVEFTATATAATGVFEETVAAGGGTLVIDDPDHDYDGLRLAIPSGMFSAATQWRFSTGTLSPKFTTPAGFTVLGPPLVVETSALRGDKLMRLEVPVDADEDDPVFLALHNTVSGYSELLTVVDRKDGAVVVATSHLRGDLLPGAGGTVQGSGAVDISSQVVPVLLHEVGPIQTALNRWPITDHGSQTNPDGMGVGIAVLQALATNGVAPDLSTAVKELSVPGFYAEAGPMALAKSAHGIISPEITQAFANIAASLDGLTIGKRDRLVVENTLAMMRFLNNPSTVAFMYEGVAKVGAATVTKASADELTLVHPAREEVVNVRLNLGGFGSFTLPLVATGPDHPVTDVVPLASTTVSFDKLKSVMADLSRWGSTVNIEQREVINRELATKAGLPPMNIRYRGSPDDEWRQIMQQIYVVSRNQQAQIELIGREFSSFKIDGSHLFSAESGPVSVMEDLELESVPPGTVLPRILTATQQGADAISRQISVITTQMAYDPFEISPSEVVLSEEDLDVDLEVSVKVPPGGGYVVEWNWGDGQVTEGAGVTTASHSYAAAGEYTVVARLLTSGDRQELAVDTLLIGDFPSAWVGDVTSVQTNTTPNFQHTLTTEAIGLRFVMNEFGLHAVTEGALTIVNDVPCANFSSTITLDLATHPQSNPTQWLLIAKTDPLDPGPTPEHGLWYQGEGSVSGIAIRHKPCIWAGNPDPQEYTFATAALYLRTSDFQVDDGWLKASDPDVIEGTYTQQTGDITETWTWRFVRVPLD